MRIFSVLLEHYKEKAIKVEKERLLVMVCVGVLVLFAGVNLSFSSNLWSGIASVLFGIVLSTVSAFLYKYNLSHSGSKKISMVTFFQEFILFFCLIFFLMVNVGIARSTINLDYGRVAPFVLFMSFCVLSIKKWKHRFVFLFSILVVGLILIEIGI